MLQNQSRTDRRSRRQDNAVSIASGITLDKIYDGKAVVLDPAKVNRSGDGAISVMYKLTEADDSTP
ncbi:MAG: hypothetical protein ACLUSP_05295 [Christensenellales bacterium]